MPQNAVDVVFNTNGDWWCVEPGSPKPLAFVIRGVPESLLDDELDGESELDGRSFAKEHGFKVEPLRAG